MRNPPTAATAAPSVVRRRSNIHGWGVFAAAPIRRNMAVGQYVGENVPGGVMRARAARHRATGHIWIFRLNDRSGIDGAVGGNVTRFINHSCTPNCYAHVMGGEIWIRAQRNIRRGEELTIDYGAGGGAIACRCRKGCPRML